MANTYRTACITGGAGFIGSRLTRRLLDRGLRVKVIDNLSVGRIENLPAGVELIEGDILDSVACEQATRGADIVFHLAARVAIRSSFDFVVEDTITNVAGTAAVLKAAARSGSVRKVITASSMGVYADNPARTPVSEGHAVIPVAPYGISKYAAECLTHAVAANAGMDSVALRLFNTYGPGQRLSPYVGVITIFASKLSRSERPVIFGDGLQTRDFVHVDDIASGFVGAMDSGVSGETINLGTGQGLTIRAVFDALAQALNVSIEPDYAEAVPGELRYSVADISKARNLLGYQPRFQFGSNIEAVVQEIVASRQPAGA